MRIRYCDSKNKVFDELPRGATSKLVIQETERRGQRRLDIRTYFQDRDVRCACGSTKARIFDGAVTCSACGAVNHGRAPFGRRLPRYDVSAIKAAITSPRALCDALGLRVCARERGGVKVRCPSASHRDSSPSLSVFVTRDRRVGFKCFGCEAKGSAIDLAMLVHGLEFAQALRWLVENVLSGEGTQAAPLDDERTPVTSPLDASTYAAIAARLIELAPLASDEGVSAYLKRRGLLFEATRAGLGALPHPMLSGAIVRSLVGEFGREALVRASILDRSGEAIWFGAHRLLIPWKGRDGRISAVQRRHLGGDSKPKYVFPSGVAPREPFGADMFDAEVARFESIGIEPTIVITEGALDCLAARAIAALERLSWVVLGAPSASEDSVDWSIVEGARVAVMFDDDDAGARGRRALRDRLKGVAEGAISGHPTGGADWGEALMGRLQ